VEAVVRLHHEALDLTGAHAGHGGHWDDDLDAIDAVYLQSGGEFLVGVLGDEIVAMGALRPLSDTDVELKRMRVLPRLQGHGIGRQLLALLEAAAHERSFARIQLDTTDLIETPLGVSMSPQATSNALVGTCRGGSP
jgi:GNAT superfamily N-acetyltransferase